MKNLSDNIIQGWIDQGRSILDLGCGDGGRLDEFSRACSARQAVGVENDEEQIRACINRGLQAIYANIEKEEALGIFKDNSFDYVLLLDTLQLMAQPRLVLQQMLRIGKQAICQFENDSHARKRLRLAAGRSPHADRDWQDGPRRLITVQDFERICALDGINIVKRRLLASTGATSLVLQCETAVYLLERKPGQ